MSVATNRLEAGGVLPAGAKVDRGAAETVVARRYAHPALGERPVVRLTSDRLGEAEDLAMEFLGFARPQVSAPVGVQQLRSLDFAAWALTKDPGNARYALNLVKRMKAARRKAKAKPGHAWDVFVDMARELGRSARHFLPPFWEDVGRTYKDLGNQTYASRALNKSLEAERVHALESDRARRRDVVVEFVLAGCLAGKALSDYAGDLIDQYDGDQAFAIFRDLCARRTRGGMAPWAAMPRDFAKLAKAAGKDAAAELESWLEEIIDAPAMGRVSLQFWKACDKHCKRIVQKNPTFAIELLRHTRPEKRYYDESTLPAWLALLDGWGAFEYLWGADDKRAPPLGEPLAHWFGRILRDDQPAPACVLDMLQRLAPRLRAEKTPLPLTPPAGAGRRYVGQEIDVDVLDACFALGLKVDDPVGGFTIAFSGWLAEEPDHPLRNAGLAEAAGDDRFSVEVMAGFSDALKCKGGEVSRHYNAPKTHRRPFPLAAGDREPVKRLWRAHDKALIDALIGSGVSGFVDWQRRLQNTLWPESLRNNPDLAERLEAFDPVAVLHRTLRAGVLDEYGLPGFEQAFDGLSITPKAQTYGGSNCFLAFPNVVLTDAVHAHVITPEGEVTKHELRLPKTTQLHEVYVVGDDLAVVYRDKDWQSHLMWASDPGASRKVETRYVRSVLTTSVTLDDGGVFFGKSAVRPGAKWLPEPCDFFHDGERFWRLSSDYDGREHRATVTEVDPTTGKSLRAGVPPWFEDAGGGEVDFQHSKLTTAEGVPADSPMGSRDGLIGWKVVRRRDGGLVGEGVDGRVWDKPLPDGEVPLGLLRQAGADALLPVSTTSIGQADLAIWDPSGSTVITVLDLLSNRNAEGQVAVLPLLYWRLLRPRHEPSSRKLRKISLKQCQALSDAAAQDRNAADAKSKTKGKTQPRGAAQPTAESPALTAAIEKLLPKAPPRMVRGIAGVVKHAERQAWMFNKTRADLLAVSRVEAKQTSTMVGHQLDGAAAAWELDDVGRYSDDEKVCVVANIEAAAAFLRGEAPAGELPESHLLWFPLVDDLLVQSWKRYWRSAAQQMKNPSASPGAWLDFLAFWQQQRIGELPGELAVLAAVKEGAKRGGLYGYTTDIDAGVSFSLEHRGDRFVCIQRQGYQGYPYLFLRHSTAEEPTTPPGYTVKATTRLKNRADPEQVTALLTAARSAEERPLPTPAELAEVGEEVGATPAEVGLVWLGGLGFNDYNNNFLPPELRKRLGWKVADAAAARQSLQNLKPAVRDRLFASVLGAGPAAPFSADRSAAFAAIAKAWGQQTAKRLPLEAALQKRLSSLESKSRWNRVGHEAMLTAAADPAGSPWLKPVEHGVKLTSDRYASLQVAPLKGRDDSDTRLSIIYSAIQLIAMIHNETPAGHPTRAAMPPLIKQLTKLLKSPKTMLPLRSVYLYEWGNRKPPKPSEWIAKHVGPTSQNKKNGTAVLDDGLVAAAAADSNHQALVAFRPGRLNDATSLARLLGVAAAEEPGDDDPSGARQPVAFTTAVLGPGFQKLADVITTPGLGEGRWPQDPRRTAPAVVAEVRGRLKLSEDAAAYYLQLLACPDPTTAHVRQWNGWTAAAVKQAAAELLAKELVLEAKRSRAGRNVFLPGEWLELKSPWLPVETWKVWHLVERDLDLTDPFPLGGPRVLRPYEELFAAAWARVAAGDKPRYEDVKNK
ncbi:MAG: hypothetical protein AAGB00_05555 [Planctomycetota bacterium]